MCPSEGGTKEGFGSHRLRHISAKTGIVFSAQENKVLKIFPSSPQLPSVTQSRVNFKKVQERILRAHSPFS